MAADHPGAVGAAGIGTVPAMAGAPVAAPAGTADVVLAGFGRRTAAAAIDTALLLVELAVMGFVVLVIVASVALGADPNTSDVPMGPALIAIVVLQIVFSWIYSAVLLTSAWQATIGMRLVGVEVTDLQGQRLSLARASARYAAKRLIVLTLYVGFFMIAATDRRQGLHDVLAGTLVVRRGRAAALRPAGATNVFDPDQVRNALDRAFLLSRDRLPADLHARVAAIRGKILEMLPETEHFPLGSHDLFVVQRTAVDYLPTSIAEYLALPQSYASTTVLPGGRTARQVLEDQLGLLDWKMDEIADAVREFDSERLLAHGRFLEESFGRPSGDLTIPEGPPSPPAAPR